MRHLQIPFLIPALWAAWIVYWLIAAGAVKRTRWREPFRLQTRHAVPLTLCAVLLGAPRWPAPLIDRFVPPGPIPPLLGSALVVAGLALAVWARACLGANWSGRVELKEGHSLVRRGPYRAVRHPIYSGLLLAIAGTALAIGEWRGLAALGFCLIGCLVRIGAEERRMDDTFPEYGSYRRQTAALIPFIY